MLERFEEAKVHAESSLALAEPGSKVHTKSLDRLLKAETALAHKRLAVRRRCTSVSVSQRREPAGFANLARCAAEYRR